jgi:hypothetical protein
MDDLFDSLKDKLENRPESSFEESAWKDMEQRLNVYASGRKRGFYWPLWVAVPILLLLVAMLGANLLMYRHVIKANQKIAAFKERIRSDTVFRTRIIYQTDTVFQTRIVKEKSVVVKEPPLWSGFWDSSDGKSPAFDFSRLTRAPLTREFLTWKAKEEKRPEQQAWNEEMLTQAMEKLHSLDLMTVRPSHVYDEIYLPSHEPPALPRRDPFRFIRVLRPQKYHLGLIGGFAAPLREGFEDEKGYAVGVTGAVDFSDRFRLWAEFSFMKLKYSTSEMNEGIGVPSIDPPLENFVFKKATVALPAWQYAAGLQYSWPLDSKWTPYVGLGYGLVKRTHYEVFYEFENDQLGLEWGLEEGVKNKKTITNQLLSRLGVEYRMSRHFIWQVEGFYRTKVRDAVPESLSPLGVRGGVLYHFK